MARSALLGSSLAKKYWMALTGLFLCVFLIAHLAGNLQLLDMSPEGQLKFNAYAKFMTTFPLVKVVSYLLYASILFHAFDGFLLTIQNRKARPVKYAYEKPGANSAWYARQMALLGTLILVFLALYVVMMGVLAFHLLHGFSSSFQSLGLNHPRYTPIIKNVGVFFAVIVPIFFALIPVWMFINA